MRRVISFSSVVRVRMQRPGLHKVNVHTMPLIRNYSRVRASLSTIISITVLSKKEKMYVMHPHRPKPKSEGGFSNSRRNRNLISLNIKHKHTHSTCMTVRPTGIGRQAGRQARRTHTHTSTRKQASKGTSWGGAGRAARPLNTLRLPPAISATRLDRFRRPFRHSLPRARR